MPTILAFDTTAGACAAALWRDGTVLAEESVAMERGHAEALMPMIERIMAKAGLPYGDLDAVAATAGPGAFTGIRIGLAAARGIALAAGIPAVGIGTLTALAAEAVASETILAVMDTKRGDLYAQAFAGGEPLGPASVSAPEGLSSLIGRTRHVAVIGDGAAVAREALRAAGVEARAIGVAAPRPAMIARLAAARLASGEPIPPPEPVYLRPPEAKRPRNGGARRP